MQIHLLIDSPFYTDRIIQKMMRFEPSSKLFVIIKSHKEVKIIEDTVTNRMSLRKLNVFLGQKNITSVYIHFLSSSIAYTLYKTQLVKLPCFWIMWGADFYGLPAVSDRYYLPLSRPFAWKNDSWKHKLARFLGLPSSAYVMKILKDIDFFVGYEEEFKLTQMALNQEMKFIPWEYYFSLDEIGRPGVNQGKGSILLGNSDDPMNNHLDVLIKLEEVIVEGQRIIVPVAGAPQVYLDTIKKVQAGSKAEIILQEKYLDSSSFFKMMDEVSYIVYGHLRQQGMGTLLPLLYAGKKVFLWNDNPLTAILKRWGLEVSLIDQLSANAFKKMTQKEVEQQRESMEFVLSTEADKKRWSRILDS